MDIWLNKVIRCYDRGAREREGVWVCHFGFSVCEESNIQMKKDWRSVQEVKMSLDFLAPHVRGNAGHSKIATLGGSHKLNEDER